MIDEVVQATKPIVDQITQLYIESAKKIQEMYEKQVSTISKLWHFYSNRIFIFYLIWYCFLDWASAKRTGSYYRCCS